MRRDCRSLICVFIFLAIPSGMTHAVQAPITDDIQVGQHVGNNRPEAAPHLQVDNRNAAFLKFDLGTIPIEVTGQDVSSATLRLWADTVRSSSSISIYLVDLPWNEESPPSMAHANPDLLIAQGVVVRKEDSQHFISFDVTVAVQSWLSGAVTNRGLALFSDGSPGALAFHSKENRAGGHEPELDISLRSSSVGGGGPSTIAIVGPPGPAGPAGAQGPQGPTGAAINPRRIALMRWYEANETGWSAATGTRPESIIFDGTEIWSANFDDDTIRKYRVANGSVIGTAPVGSGPMDLAIDGLNIWVANSASNNLMKLESVTGALQATIAAGTTPVALIFDGTHIWSANQGSGDLTKVRASDAVVLGTFAAGTAPRDLVYDGVNLWVANSGDNTIIKMNPDDGSILDTFAVGAVPSGLTYDGENIWVAHSGDGTVAKLDASTGMLLGTFPAGTSPSQLAFDGEAVWITNTGSNNVTKLRALDGSLLGTFSVGAGPSGITFDGVYLWVANSLDNTMSKL
jgi:DNA-binding beta-propeller fold protein YncE